MTDPCPKCAARLAAVEAERDALAAKAARDARFNDFLFTFGGAGMLIWLGGDGLKAAFAQQYHPAWGAIIVVAAMLFIEMGLAGILHWCRGDA
jgi:hypothetical protein